MITRATDLDGIGATVPKGVKCWTWEVLPKASHLPMIGLGITDNELNAKRDVEATMRANPETSEYGILRGPQARRERCMRNRSGTLTWLTERYWDSKDLQPCALC